MDYLEETTNAVNPGVVSTGVSSSSLEGLVGEVTVSVANDPSVEFDNYDASNEPSPEISSWGLRGYIASKIYAKPSLGKDRVPFDAYKFKTMVDGADEKFKEIKESAGVDSRGNIDDSADPRITRFGRIARPTHLDETPNLYNIFKGEMSWLGVRPMSEEHWDELVPDRSVQDIALKRKPGLYGINYAIGLRGMPLEDQITTFDRIMNDHPTAGFVVYNSLITVGLATDVATKVFSLPLKATKKILNSLT